jgi:hypothetical protein
MFYPHHAPSWRGAWWSSPCRWGETTSLNCGHQRAYCSSRRWYMSKENNGGVISTGEYSSFVHQRSLVILPAVIW